MDIMYGSPYRFFKFSFIKFFYCVMLNSAHLSLLLSFYFCFSSSMILSLLVVINPHVYYLWILVIKMILSFSAGNVPTNSHTKIVRKLSQSEVDTITDVYKRQLSVILVHYITQHNHTYMQRCV